MNLMIHNLRNDTAAPFIPRAAAHDHHRDDDRHARPGPTAQR